MQQRLIVFVAHILLNRRSFFFLSLLNNSLKIPAVK